MFSMKNSMALQGDTHMYLYSEETGGAVDEQ